MFCVNYINRDRSQFAVEDFINLMWKWEKKTQASDISVLPCCSAFRLPRARANYVAGILI